MKLALRVLATAVATAVAVWLVPGLSVDAPTLGGQAAIILVVAVILGLVNAVIKPITSALSTCLIVLTLGLFLFVINALMLMLTAWLSQQLGFGFVVDGFWSALFGSIIISVVGAVVAWLLGAGKD